jgi:EmrB/QacA subfamily drug resistance transporter
MNRTGILVVCCTAQFMGLLDITIVNVALPSIGADLDLSTTGLQWVVNAYTLALAGFLLLGGRAADLLGRRETFAGGLALLALASLAGGLATEGTTLLAARAGQGLGAALVAPAGLSILATSFAAGPERNRALAWWGTLGGLGGATGALVGGLLTATASWRWVMLVNAPICLGAAVVALRVVPARRSRTGAIDLRGALTLSAGLVLLTLGIVNAEGRGLTATLVPTAAGTTLLGLFLAREARAPAPLVPLGLFRSRAVSGAAGVVLCLGAVTFSMWFLLTLHVQQVLGLSALDAGIALAPISLTIIASTRLGARLSTRVGPARVAAAGMALLAAGMVLLARVDHVLVPSLLCAAGIGCSFVPATIAAMAAVADDRSGLVSGVLNTAYQVGSSLGLALVATVLTSPEAGFSAAFLLGGCLAATGSAVAMTVLR